MRRITVLAFVLLALAPGARRAAADVQTIRGAMFQVRDAKANGDPRWRSVLVSANEPVGTPNDVIGHPATGGATLRILVRGPGAVYDQTFVLPAEGWKEAISRHDWPVFKGFFYNNRNVGGAVRRIYMQRGGYASVEGQPPPETPGPGLFRMRVALVGRDGPIDLRPPAPGTSGGMWLTIAGGDTYCVAFGGAAGGTLIADTERRFAIKQATAEGCPEE
jgi:hypothetical protein